MTTYRINWPVLAAWIVLAVGLLLAVVAPEGNPVVSLVAAVCCAVGGVGAGWGIGRAPS